MLNELNKMDGAAEAGTARSGGGLFGPGGGHSASTTRAVALLERPEGVSCPAWEVLPVWEVPALAPIAYDEDDDEEEEFEDDAEFDGDEEGAEAEGEEAEDDDFLDDDTEDDLDSDGATDDDEAEDDDDL